MKVCITSKGDSFESEMDPRFGRTPYFIIFNSDTGEWEALRNEKAELSGGAGVQAAQMIAERQVELILTGKVGPHASEALKAAGIDIATGVSGKVSDAARNFQAGKSTDSFIDSEEDSCE